MFKYEWHLNGHWILTGWGILQVFFAQPSLGHQKVRLFALWNFIKSITQRLVCRFSRLRLSSVLITQARFRLRFFKKIIFVNSRFSSNIELRIFPVYKISELVTMIKRLKPLIFALEIYVSVELIEEGKYFLRMISAF